MKERRQEGSSWMKYTKCPKTKRLPKINVRPLTIKVIAVKSNSSNQSQSDSERGNNKKVLKLAQSRNAGGFRKDKDKSMVQSKSNYYSDGRKAVMKGNKANMINLSLKPCKLFSQAELNELEVLKAQKMSTSKGDRAN
jgi:hypothetical protein